MKAEELFIEMIETTGEWAVPEFTKILEAEMQGYTHRFKVLFYNHGIGDREIEITMTEKLTD
jgi:hypothetical protein